MVTSFLPQQAEACDYLHGLEMIKVEAGPELLQAVETISVESSIPITPEQEADLRGWLYDFLVAFSVSGSDSLAAEFYLREGVNDPEAIQRMKDDFINQARAYRGQIIAFLADRDAFGAREWFNDDDGWCADLRDLPRFHERG